MLRSELDYYQLLNDDITNVLYVSSAASTPEILGSAFVPPMDPPSPKAAPEIPADMSQSKLRVPPVAFFHDSCIPLLE